MKKKFAGLFCAMVLAMGLPAMAFAATYNSPTQTGTATSGNVSVVAKGGNVGNGAYITVEASAKAASTVPSGVTPIASFEVTESTAGLVSEANPLTLTFNVGVENAGKTAKVYVQHSDGTAGETITTTVAANGTITITVTKLSIYSVVIEDGVTPANQPSVDTSATSPQTGVNMGLVAGGTVVALMGAGCVAFALRKKLAK